MRPAIKPRARRDETRVLVARRGSEEVRELKAAELPSVLGAGDLLVVNDAAALPASLRAENEDVEFRLTGPIDDGRAPAIAFGAGDWRIKTEDRPLPRVLRRLDRFVFRGGLRAHLDSADGREVELHFDAPATSLPSALYRAADAIQYSYLSQKLELWDIQTVYASRPWAVEAPSAGFALSFATLKALLLAGVNLARVTHAAGLSSSGDGLLDQKFPAPERYEIPSETVRLIEETKARGGRVIAVGTTVVRALEGAAEASGALRSGAGVTALRLSPSSKLRVVEGLLTGVHEPTESHFQLMGAFADELLQRRINDEAEQRGFLSHEFGDAVLLLPS
jgi:S-adenosylmethionine:tRNA ribosyltransferase-isomerase